MIDIGLVMSLGRQLKEMQNKTNFENRCLVFLIRKNKTTTESVIFRLYSKDIVKQMSIIRFLVLS